MDKIPNIEHAPLFYSNLEELHLTDCQVFGQDLLDLIRLSPQLRFLKVSCRDSQDLYRLLVSIQNNAAIKDVSLRVGIYSNLFSPIVPYLEAAHVRELQLDFKFQCSTNEAAEILSQIGLSRVLEKLTITGVLYYDSFKMLCRNLKGNFYLKELTLDMA